MIAAETGSRLVSRPERVTVAEWLKRHVELKARDVRARTRENYDHYLAKILPELGHLQLQGLKPLHIRSLYAQLSGAGLSPSVRQHVHHFLKGALREAVRMELLQKSPADVLDPPRGGRVQQSSVWDVEQVERFLEAAKGDRLFAAFYLMLAMGLTRIIHEG
jgi:integrase